MTRNRWRYGILATLLAMAFGTGIGCNVMAPFFIFSYLAQPLKPPRFEFPDFKEPARVLVMTYVEDGTQMAAARLDHELNEAVSRKLFETFTADEKKIKLVLASEVAKWKDKHTDWRTLDANEIGKQLRADYVIYIEVEDVSFFEDRGSRHLFRGRAEVSVSVIQVNDDEGEVVFPKDVVNIEYPRTRPIHDTDFKKFRREFVKHLTQQIAWFFVPHDTAEEFAREPI